MAKMLERIPTLSILIFLNIIAIFVQVLDSQDIACDHKPNILIILADDLGFGDLSVPPFVGSGIKTPELEMMASMSTIMTNFHVAAPICTPTRASILTGLFPWRLGIKSIYGTGVQAKDVLRVVPNMPTTFRSAGYHTAHVGKWHLGGMTPNDISQRNAMRPTCQGANPGPNQHGYDEYVAMMEGPGSVRLTSLLPKSTLYHEGARHLLRNDQPYLTSGDILTDRQATEAIRIMNETVAIGKKFFLQVWFDAPHSPWEMIHGPWLDWYNEKAVYNGPQSKTFKYATMVSSMDHNIGRLRRAVESLGIVKDTIIVFLSDNGPENGAGSAGPFKGRKRSLLEGGIRVPAIWQWVGRFPARQTSHFGLSTDIFPTLLHAAGIPQPSNVRIDGVSLLPALVNREVPLVGPGSVDGLSYSRNNSNTSTSSSPNCIVPPYVHALMKGSNTDIVSGTRNFSYVNSFTASMGVQVQIDLSWFRHGDERVVTWFKDLDGRGGAVWSHGYKLHIDGANRPTALYDMRSSTGSLRTQHTKRSADGGRYGPTWTEELEDKEQATTDLLAVATVGFAGLRADKTFPFGSAKNWSRQLANMQLTPPAFPNTFPNTVSVVSGSANHQRRLLHIGTLRNAQSVLQESTLHLSLRELKRRQREASADQNKLSSHKSQTVDQTVGSARMRADTTGKGGYLQVPAQPDNDKVSGTVNGSDMFRGEYRREKVHVAKVAAYLLRKGKAFAEHGADAHRALRERSTPAFDGNRCKVPVIHEVNNLQWELYPSSVPEF